MKSKYFNKIQTFVVNHVAGDNNNNNNESTPADITKNETTVENEDNKKIESNDKSNIESTTTPTQNSDPSTDTDLKDESVEKDDEKEKESLNHDESEETKVENNSNNKNNKNNKKDIKKLEKQKQKEEKERLEQEKIKQREEKERIKREEKEKEKLEKEKEREKLKAKKEEELEKIKEEKEKEKAHHHRPLGLSFFKKSNNSSGSLLSTSSSSSLSTPSSPNTSHTDLHASHENINIVINNGNKEENNNSGSGNNNENSVDLSNSLNSSSSSVDVVSSSNGGDDLNSSSNNVIVVDTSASSSSHAEVENNNSETNHVPNNNSSTGNKREVVIKVTRAFAAVVHQNLVKEEGEHKMRNMVINEIINTEKDYIADLNVMINFIYNPLKESKLITDKDLSTIFSNIQLLLPVNNALLSDLVKAANETEGQSVGPCFKYLADYLKIYSSYCANQKISSDHLALCSKKSPAFKQFLDEKQMSPECRQGNLDSFLIKPVQRLCKYPLLLRELIKNSIEGHPDIASLEEAYSKIQTVVLSVNESKRKAEVLQKMYKIHKKLESTEKFDFLTPTRYLIREDTLKELTEEKDKVSGKMHYYLFNDIIMRTKKEKKTIRLETLFVIASTQINGDENRNSSFCNTFELSQVGREGRKFTLVCDTYEQKMEWMTDIEQLIRPYQEESMREYERLLDETPYLAMKRSTIATTTPSQPQAPPSPKSLARSATASALPSKVPIPSKPLPPPPPKHGQSTSNLSQSLNNNNVTASTPSTINTPSTTTTPPPTTKNPSPPPIQNTSHHPPPASPTPAIPLRPQRASLSLPNNNNNNNNIVHSTSDSTPIPSKATTISTPTSTTTPPIVSRPKPPASTRKMISTPTQTQTQTTPTTTTTQSHPLAAPVVTDIKQPIPKRPANRASVPNPIITTALVVETNTGEESSASSPTRNLLSPPSSLSSPSPDQSSPTLSPTTPVSPPHPLVPKSSRPLPTPNSPTNKSAPSLPVSPSSSTNEQPNFKPIPFPTKSQSLANLKQAAPNVSTHQKSHSTFVPSSIPPPSTLHTDDIPKSKDDLATVVKPIPPSRGAMPLPPRTGTPPNSSVPTNSNTISSPEPKSSPKPLPTIPPVSPPPPPNGLRTARKLRTHRREQRWNDKHYKKAHFGTALKANPFGGASHASGIVISRLGIEAKQPNSAIRKCVRVQLKKNGKRITAFVPNDGCLNYIQDNDKVLIAGFGRSGHAVGDIPGVRFKVVKVSSVSLIAIYRGLKDKPNV
eukprot:gene2775-3449_t